MSKGCEFCGSEGKCEAPQKILKHAQRLATRGHQPVILDSLQDLLAVDPAKSTRRGILRKLYCYGAVEGMKG